MAGEIWTPWVYDLAWRDGQRIIVRKGGLHAPEFSPAWRDFAALHREVDKDEAREAVAALNGVA